MRSKVNFADVVVAQHSGVSCVWGVVGSTVVDWAASWEGQTRLQPVFFDKSPGAVLQLLTARRRKQHEGRMDDSNTETIVKADYRNHGAVVLLPF